MDLARIFIAALLIENVVLIRFLALCPFIGVSADVEKSMGMSMAVTFVTVLATCVTWPFFRFILEPLGLVFLQIVVFILVIAVLVQLVEFYLRKSTPGLYNAMGIYLPLITTNCAILAVTMENISNEYNFVQAIVYSLGVAFGFLIAMVLLAGIRQGIKTSPIPAFLKGTPILFVCACLLSMAFMGFSGLIK